MEWEKFERGVGGRRPVKKVLKGKASLLAQDVVFTPCNPRQCKHWFFLGVLLIEKINVALDSLASGFIRPTIEGTGPFQFLKVTEVEHVHHHLRKSRERKEQ